MNPPERVQSLWIGDTLSVMENSSIQSFLNLGCDFHLHTYGKVGNVPSGVNICDANEIVPEARVFKYRDYDSYAGFANYFRYALLLKKGGCWTDLDIICLRPLHMADDYFFAGDTSSRTLRNRLYDFIRAHINCCFLKAPAGCALCRRAVDYCETRDASQLAWGDTGPNLTCRLAHELGLQRHIAPVRAICAIPYFHWRDLISGNPAIQARRLRQLAAPGVLAVHLWNEMWRRNGVDKNQSFPPGCVYEQLKRAVKIAANPS